ncbi:hypothetical protein MAPG_10467 [Magnaporthiopsis poae ATCC 64411]|uniref:C2H2-type domain-containing protein n=1 Tax=Magnaporthiopsis poae (strain ATCC 64411 / 73-15) TaxID=644358 RepID=A0A0C4ECN6_MAGP6|nr:hypothetical protein MAPG_10467 [Magnaporthiopsis poae ATCC 64411]
MAPRHQTLPPAQTTSARAAMQSFYCQLCTKGYSRMNDYEAHLSSYDHSHKQRLKDMKAMVRDSGAAARARKAEAKADGAIVSVKIETEGGGGGASSGGAFKKSGFKKTGFKTAAFVRADQPAAPVPEAQAADETSDRAPDSVEAASTASPPFVTTTAPAAVASTLAPPDTSDTISLGDQYQEPESDDDVGYEMYDPRFPTD